MGASESTERTNGNPTRITWSPPPLGRFKMNTDGACRPNGDYRSNNDNVDRGPSGCGGILRDHRGKWIRGFYEYLGVSDCHTAEFQGIYNGLLLLDTLGLKKAILEADSTSAVGWITQDANDRRQRPVIIKDCWNVITECKRLIEKNKISVISCPREANKCADKLASMAIEKREAGCKEITRVPDEIKNIVDQESNGGSSTGSGAAAVALAAVGVAAYGISKMLSDNTDSQQNQNAMNMNNGGSSTTLLEYSPNSSTYNNNYQGDQVMRSVSFPARITWSPPPSGCFKMNTDGGCRPYGCGRFNNDNVDRGPSGYGGILRDHRGKWVRGFYGYLDVSDCLTAEFHGIYKGLLLLDRLGLKEAILEADSTSAVGWITQDANYHRQRPMIIQDCWSVITDCKRLIVKNKIRVISCPREANKSADKLASMAIEKREAGYKEIVSVPDEIKNIVDQESMMV